MSHIFILEGNFNYLRPFSQKAPTPKLLIWFLQVTKGYPRFSKVPQVRLPNVVLGYSWLPKVIIAFS